LAERTKMINDFNGELRNAFDQRNLKKLRALQCPSTHGHGGAVRAQRLSLRPLARKNRRLRPLDTCPLVQLPSWVATRNVVLGATSLRGISCA
jgi:hypothetical protein